MPPTVMDFSQRKFRELNQKLESLTLEFGYWREESAESQSLQKHHWQIRRIISQLEGMQHGIRKELEGMSQGEGFLSEVRNLELDILEVHRVWEFFRSKFVLRSVDWFNPYLVAADEFAWAAYNVVQQNFNYVNTSAEDTKEPPLVFFNGSSSPYTLPRNLAYQAEEVADEELRSVQSSQLLKQLPIPIIGIPWFQVQHLPDALVIGHEVGHDVEEDFHLTARIETLLARAMEQANIDPTHRPAWEMWLRELFADLYGNLIGGPAFVSSLMDFLAADKTATETYRPRGPRWGSYPPDYLRILINLHALELQGFQTESDQLRQDLKNAYDTHAMQDFEIDIPPIVKALIDEPYPEFKNRSLKQVVGFTKINQTNAVTDSEHLLNGHSPASNNVRVLFAAARLAYNRNPERYKSKKAHELILSRVPEIQTEGTRGKKFLADLRKREPTAWDTFDRSAGEKLFVKLKGNRDAQ